MSLLLNLAMSKRAFPLLRKALYINNWGDAEKVHEAAKGILNRMSEDLAEIGNYFDSSGLEFKLKNIEFKHPFGTAAGFDKDCEILEPLSHIFGYQTPGTIVLNIRAGNQKPRLKSDTRRGVIYNAQGFPSRGLEFSKERLRGYQDKFAMQDKVPIIASFCGLPQEGNLQEALMESNLLINGLAPHVQGLEWNPASPNTATLKQLRTPEVFKRVCGGMMRYSTDERLTFVKFPPYSTSEEIDQTFELISVVQQEGIDGIVLTNTRKISYPDFPFGTAGESGKPLSYSRKKAVRDVAREFPPLIIKASGGYWTAQDIIDDMPYVTLFDGFTVYTQRGPGAVKDFIGAAKYLLDKGGFTSYQSFLDKRNKTLSIR